MNADYLANADLAQRLQAIWPWPPMFFLVAVFLAASSLFGVGGYDHLLLHQTAPPTSLLPGGRFFLPA